MQFENQNTIEKSRSRFEGTTSCGLLMSKERYLHLQFYGNLNKFMSKIP